MSSERNALLVTILFLAAMGIAVPHLDDSTLSTLLVVAGAGLASLLMLLPAEQQYAQTHSRCDDADIVRPARLTETRFTELSRDRAIAANLDRATWAKLTAQMSHELRTPLNAVLGFSELMTNEVFGPLGATCYSAYARDIHASGRILLKTAEDALAITNLLAGSDLKANSTASLQQAMEDAATFLAPDFTERRISFASGLHEGLDVVADPQATRQMLINILADLAAKAERDAHIAVRADNTAEGTRLLFSLSAAKAEPDATQDTFCTVLARTLCDLAGAELSPEVSRDGSVERAICFEPAVQNDLFRN